MGGGGDDVILQDKGKNLFKQTEKSVHKLPLYWKQSASLLRPAALADDGGDKVGDDEALPLSSAGLLTAGVAGAAVSAVAAGVAVAGNRFLAPIDPFLKRTSWRGVDILVYSSVKNKKKRQEKKKMK